MRFDEFALRVPGEGDEGLLHIRFHDRLTVLAGLGAVEREAIVAAVVGALCGEADGATLRYTDSTGRPVELTSTGGIAVARHLDDGSPAPEPVGWLAPDPLTLRDIVVITADDLGPSTAARPRDDDPPVLVEARAHLAALTERLQRALADRAALERLEAELAEVDEQLARAEEAAARRAYARVLARLERVRAEASVLAGGAHGAEADRLLLAARDELAELTARWREAAAAAEAARAEAAGDEPLTADDVARLAAVPEAPPAELGELVAEWVRAARHAEALEDRLRHVAGATLPKPGDPRVLALATADQDELWAARDAVVEARARLAAEQVALGGIGADGADAERSAAIARLERAHGRVVAAGEVVRRNRVPVGAATGVLAVAGVPAAGAALPLALGLWAAAAGVAGLGLVRPLVDRRRAARAEQACLEAIGVPSYLSFHLRRVDATLDPSALDRLTAARVEVGAAERAWVAVAGDVDVETATELEPAVRAHAEALAAQAGAVREVAELRRSLEELALPDLDRARARLAAAVAPYGIGADDLAGLEPALVVDFVAGQVALGAAARRRRAADAAAAEEAAAASALEVVLARHGFVHGDLAARVEVAEAAVRRAADREAARAAARPRAVVEAELAELAAEARRLRRPEWGDVRPEEAEEPDMSALIARRDQLAAAVAAEAHRAREVERLQDEHAAAERRVRSLDRRLRGSRADDAAIEELHRYLLAALTRAHRAGPGGEPVPVVLDDPFTRVPAERKWELMDMLRRLTEKTQVVYVTDDPFIGAWARRRADHGAIRLLEPVE